MSKYTMELRFLVENEFDLGLKEYSIFSEEYRDKLNKKIIDHYYFHEIGFETASRFKHYLNSTMNEIMCYYDKLYQSELLSINPLLSFERKSNITKETDTSKFENINNKISKAVENIESKNSTLNTNKSIDNTSNQLIDNSSSIDNTTNSNSDETQKTDITANQNTSSNSNRELGNNSTVNDKDIFSETPQSLLTDTDLTNGVYATDARIKENNLVNSETESNDNTESIVKNDNSLVNTSNSTNIINSTDSKSNTSNNSSFNTDEKATNIGSENLTNTLDETSLSDTDNVTNMNVNEINVITENGYEIPLADLLIKYRQTFLNIDKLVIAELSDLFMKIY